MRKLFVLLFILIVLQACGVKGGLMPIEGEWRGILEVKDGHSLPFSFDLHSEEGAYQMILTNAEEEIVLTDIEIDAESVLIRMPVYEGYIKAKYDALEMKGFYIKESLNRVVPFTAEWAFGNSRRFEQKNKSNFNVSGNWETVFSAGIDDQYMAKGIFRQYNDSVVGTFRTNKGDYRYLEGVMDGDSLKLSTFDGAHAFLFLAKVEDKKMSGMFYSGNHFKEPFTAELNEIFELPDSDELTFIKEGYDSLDFSFPDGNGNTISLSDFENKVVVVQIMGTWCPNCMDETKFFVEYLKENDHPDLQFVALAFEYAKTEEAAYKGIQRFKKRVGVDYPILLAQYGTSNKVRANEKLPMLNHVLSYPTTIFIDRRGEVRRIHTGFNGPATGEKFVEFKADFGEEIRSLLAE